MTFSRSCANQNLTVRKLSEKCDKCGLPSDLCVCEEISGVNLKLKTARGQGIMSPPKVYYCTKCHQNLSWSQTETYICPCCGRAGLRHKGECGGNVTEKDFRDMFPISYGADPEGFEDKLRKRKRKSIRNQGKYKGRGKERRREP